MYGENIGAICAGKCEITLHSCISVMISSNEQKISMATGPLCVHTKWEDSHLKLGRIEMPRVSDLVKSATFLSKRLNYPYTRAMDQCGI